MKIKVVNKKRLMLCIIALVIIIVAIIAAVNGIMNKETKPTSSDDLGNVVSQNENIVSENTITNEDENMIAQRVGATITDETVISTKRGLPVLMYHFFYDKNVDGEKGTDNNFMEVSAFEEQMKYLSDNDYYFPTWQEVEDFIDKKIGLPEKSVVITIDDGAESFIKYAIPIIEKYNVRATSFVVTSWNGNWLPATYKSSHLDFQSHSHDMHRAGANGKGRFVNLSYAEGVEDVKKSKELIGEDCIVFCYPFGHYNDTAIKALKDTGFKLAFTTKGGRVYQGSNKYQLPRVRMSKGISLSAFKEAVK